MWINSSDRMSFVVCEPIHCLQVSNNYSGYMQFALVHELDIPCLFQNSSSYPFSCSLLAFFNCHQVLITMFEYNFILSFLESKPV